MSAKAVISQGTFLDTFQITLHRTGFFYHLFIENETAKSSTNVVKNEIGSYAAYKNELL
jgi:hypothetical protein